MEFNYTPQLNVCVLQEPENNPYFSHFFVDPVSGGIVLINCSRSCTDMFLLIVHQSDTINALFFFYFQMFLYRWNSRTHVVQRMTSYYNHHNIFNKKTNCHCVFSFGYVLFKKLLHNFLGVYKYKLVSLKKKKRWQMCASCTRQKQLTFRQCSFLFLVPYQFIYVCLMHSARVTIIDGFLKTRYTKYSINS